MKKAVGARPQKKPEISLCTPETRCVPSTNTTLEMNYTPVEFTINLQVKSVLYSPQPWVS